MIDETTRVQPPLDTYLGSMSTYGDSTNETVNGRSGSRPSNVPNPNSDDHVSNMPFSHSRPTGYGTTSDPQDAVCPHSEATGEQDYPEGGFEAWLVVFGAWCCMIGGLALLNSIGPLQSYIARHQLSLYPESTVSWIFSIQLFIVFFSGIQVGPLFDVLGPRILVAVGSVCLVLSMALLGQCTKYWHFILDFSVLSGLACSLLLTPPLATIGHFFNRRRAFATGVAMTGPSIGGVILPLVFRATYPRLGFPWACRILALIILVLLIPANIFLRSRLPRRKPTFREVIPDFSIFLDGDGALAFATAGFFLMELSLFIPLAYITSYAISAGLNRDFAYNVIAILNAASVVGRSLPGFIADRVGRYNTMAWMLVLCMLCNLCIWLPATLIPSLATEEVRAFVIAYAIIFGLASGSNLSLIGPCIGQLCETKHYGRYFSTSYFFVSIATLIGIPIAGKLIDAARGSGPEGRSGYWSLVTFVGVGYAASTVCMAAVRIIKVGWEPRNVF